MTTDKAIQLAIGGALGLGGLGLGIYNWLDTDKQMNKANNSMLNLNGRMRNIGMSATDPKLVNLLKREIRTNVPVVTVTDKQKIEELGIGDNAFYVSPEGAASLSEVLDIPGYKDGDGAVVVSGKFSSLPILAHELGHAKDYEEGKMSDPYVTDNIRDGGLLLSGLATVMVPSLFRKYFSSRGSILPATAAGIGSGLAILGLTQYLASRRELGDERRASEKAKQALTRVAEKLGKHKELKNTDKMLDTAMATYQADAKFDVRVLLATALGAGGILTAAGALTD